MKDPHEGEYLPPSINEVLEAVDQLEEALYGPGFPSLNPRPDTDQAVGDVVRAAARWAKTVRRAYGAGERQRVHKGTGVLPCFKAGSGFGAYDGNPVTLLGELPDEYIVAERIGRDLTIFEYAFSHSRELLHGQARSLTDPGKRGIPFTLDNWDEIRRRLLIGYGGIVKRALGLSNWIKGRIQELETAVVPRIRKVGTGSHNRLKVEVLHAASTREIEVTHTQADFLRGLARDGTVTVSRRTKKDLLDRIPELRPWIENRSREPEADITNQATYGVAPQVQKSIWIED